MDLNLDKWGVVGANYSPIKDLLVNNSANAKYWLISNECSSESEAVSLFSHIRVSLELLEEAKKEIDRLNQLLLEKENDNT